MALNGSWEKFGKTLMFLRDGNFSKIYLIKFCLIFFKFLLIISLIFAHSQKEFQMFWGLFLRKNFHGFLILLQKCKKNILKNFSGSDKLSFKNLFRKVSGKNFPKILMVFFSIFGKFFPLTFLNKFLNDSLSDQENN